VGVPLLEQHVAAGGRQVVLVDAAAHGGVALGVEVHEQHALGRGRQRRGQVDRGGGLADPAFLVGDSDDAGHMPAGASGRWTLDYALSPPGSRPTTTRWRSAASPGTVSGRTSRTRQPAGSAAISASGTTPFIASRTPPGLSRCPPRSRISGRVASARAVIASNVPGASTASIRDSTTRALARPRVRTASRMN